MMRGLRAKWRCERFKPFFNRWEQNGRVSNVLTHLLRDQFLLFLVFCASVLRPAAARAEAADAEVIHVR
jgi:hypothetical protein